MTKNVQQADAMDTFDAALRDFESRQAQRAAHEHLEPWRIASPEMFATIIDQEGQQVAYCDSGDALADETHARRIVACVNACIGIPTAQLEAMNAQQMGLLAHAYDVCAEIVEDWRHELEDDAPIPGADAVDTLSRIGGDALAVCRWALVSDNGLDPED